MLVLFSVIATKHMWRLSVWNVAGATKKRNFQILFNFKLIKI